MRPAESVYHSSRRILQLEFQFEKTEGATTSIRAYEIDRNGTGTTKYSIGQTASRLPGSVRSIILMESLGLLPALDENLGELPIQFLPRSGNHIEGSLSALVSGQMCHFATTQFGFHPLKEPFQYSVLWERRERGFIRLG